MPDSFVTGVAICEEINKQEKTVAELKRGVAILQSRLGADSESYKLHRADLQEAKNKLLELKSSYYVPKK